MGGRVQRGGGRSRFSEIKKGSALGVCVCGYGGWVGKGERGVMIKLRQGV